MASNGEQPTRVAIGSSGEYVEIGRGPWLRWYLPGFHDVRVRVGDHGGRLVIRGLSIEAYDEHPSPDPAVWPHVAAADLRGLPLGRLDLVLNDPTTAEVVRAALRQRGAATLRPGRARLAYAQDDREAALAERRRWTETRTGQRVAASAEPTLRLDVPSGRRRPDTFYAQVVAAFSRAAGTSKHPAVEIATANDVPVTTVHRWIKEARRRGLLAPAGRTRGGRPR